MQDIRGAKKCDLCGHAGYMHAIGFFCLGEKCCCGHNMENIVHQKHGGVRGGPCSSCDPATSTWKGPTGFDKSDERGVRHQAVAEIRALEIKPEDQAKP